MTIQADSLLTVLTISLGVIAIVVSIVTVALALYFHRQNTVLNLELNKIVSEIGTNTKLTEITTQNLIDPIVRAILQIVQGQTRTSIDHLRSDIMEKLTEKVETVLKSMPAKERQEIQGKLSRELDSALSVLKRQIEMPSDSFGKQPTAPEMARHPTAGTPIPGSGWFSWMPFVRRIRDMEPHNRFLGVNMLRQKAFALEPENREALQAAIDGQMLLTYHVDNPKNPQFPTLACKLNREHPVIRAILEVIGERPVHEGGQGIDKRP